MSSHREEKFVGLINQLGTNVEFQQQILGTSGDVVGYSMDRIEVEFAKAYGKPLTDEQRDELNRQLAEMGYR